MLTLVHATQSRSFRILWLLEELGADYDIRAVSIRRRDGSEDMATWRRRRWPEECSAPASAVRRTAA